MATDPIDADGQTPFERIPTGIPGLDTVLRGGFLKAGIYIVRGDPGRARRSSETSSASIMSPPGTMQSTSPFWRKRTTA